MVPAVKAGSALTDAQLVAKWTNIYHIRVRIMQARFAKYRVAWPTQLDGGFQKRLGMDVLIRVNQLRVVSTVEVHKVLAMLGV